MNYPQSQGILLRLARLIPALFIILLSCNRPAGDKSYEITFNYLQDENRIEVFFGDELFTAYIFSGELPKPVLYPLNIEDEIPLTRGFPLHPSEGERVDHPHQVGHWLNYGNVNGLDFWNNPGNLPAGERDSYGFIEHGELFRMENGNGKGELVVSALWKNYNGNIVLRENTTFVFGYSGNNRIIDRVTTLTAMNSDVLFTDDKEGMIAIRVAREMELPGGDIPVVIGPDGNPNEAAPDYHNRSTGNYLSSDGLTGDDVWGTRAGWMVLNGTVQNRQTALAIIDHPENPGYPTYWHARGYGLFSANPLGQAEFSEGEEELNLMITQGESVTFRYRIVVHSGGHLTAEETDRLAEEFQRHIL